MGTRAVVHVDLRPFSYGKDIWIATHWDGYPEGLGETLKKELKKELVKIPKGEMRGAYLGSALQKAVGKASAEHTIDVMTTGGKDDFDNQYGDWAEYLYEITPKGELKVKPLSSAWEDHKGITKTKWKILKTFGFNLKSKKKLREVV